jgi:hypothetical protein
MREKPVKRTQTIYLDADVEMGDCFVIYSYPWRMLLVIPKHLFREQGKPVSNRVSIDKGRNLDGFTVTGDIVDEQPTLLSIQSPISVLYLYTGVGCNIPAPSECGKSGR